MSKTIHAYLLTSSATSLQAISILTSADADSHLINAIDRAPANGFDERDTNMPSENSRHYDTDSLRTRTRSAADQVTLRLRSYPGEKQMTWDRMQRVRAICEAADIVTITTKLGEFCTQVTFEKRAPNDDTTLTASVRAFEDVMKCIFNGNILGDSVCLVEVYEASPDGSVIDVLYDT